MLYKFYKKCYIFKLIDYFYQKSKYLYFRKYAQHIGDNLRIYGNFFFYNEENIYIGNNVHINEGVVLNGRGNISIGDNTIISAFSQLQSTGLNTKDISSHYHTKHEITIGKNVWICANATIIGPATIGDGAVIASHAVIKGNIPPNELWGGVPAKKIKSL